MSNHLERARYFLQLDRLDEAEKEVREALSMEPNNAFALSLLSGILVATKRKEMALDFARQAVGIAPYSFYCLYNLALAEWINNNVEKAQEAIDSAIRLDPTNPELLELKAEIAYKNEDWEAALHTIETALQFDAGSVTLINLRAKTLVKLNRTAEAAETISYALHNAPENSDSHTNKGWVAIETGDLDDAFASFKEALRLRPGNEYARSGLLEAIKGRNIFYRGIQKYFLWMEKLSSQYRWGVFIGAYLIYRFVLSLYESHPEYAPLLLPLIVFYITFAFASWIARAVSNLALRLHPMAKYILEDEEKEESTYAGVLLSLVLLGLVLYFGFQLEFGLSVGLVSGLLLIPLGGAYSFPKSHPTFKKLYYFFLGMTVVGALWAFTDLGILAVVFLLSIFFYSFVFNYLVQMERKRFN